MTTPDPTWQRARELARRQWDDEAIVGRLAGDDASEAEVARIVEMLKRGHASLERAREEGKGLIRDEVWAIAMGERELGKEDAARWQALYALARTHVGYGETHDAAQVREAARTARRAQKAGKTGPRLVGGTG